MPAILPRERWSKPQLSLSPSLGSERIRIPHEYCWRGRRTRIFHLGYCYISGHQCLCRGAHSVLKHRLGATSVATFITKRACLLRSQRSVRSFGGRRLWRGPSAAEGASSWDGYWGRVACDAEYGLPRIPIPRTWVNKGKIYFTAPSY